MKQVLIICSFFIATTMYSQNSTYQNKVNEGFKALVQQDITTAITNFQDAYKIDSSKVEASYGLGVAYNFFCQKAGSYCKESLYFLNKAISIDDNYRKCYYNRGCCKAILLDYMGAIDDFSYALKKQPDNPTFYVGRGKTYLMLNLKEKGCVDIKKAAELNSSEAKTLLHQACQK